MSHLMLKIRIVIIFLIFATTQANTTSKCPEQCGCITKEGSNFEISSLMCTNFPNSVPKEVDYFTIKNAMLTTLNENQLSALSNVKILTLQNLGIETIEDGAFSQMVHLEIVRLANNKITRITTQTFAQCNNLMEINLEMNNIKSIQTDAFANLMHLHKLYLSHNNLRMLPSILPASLMELRVEKNFINELPVIINKLDHLKKLNLCGNTYKIFKSEHFNAPHLQQLCLGDNVELINLKTFKEGSLHTLEIRSKNIDLETILNALKDFNNIEHLILKDSRISNLKNLKLTLNKLTILRLNRVHSDKLSLELFQATPNLQVLDLSSSPKLAQTVLNDTAILKQLQRIRILILSETSLTSLTEDILNKFTELKKLDISSNPLHCDCTLGWIKKNPYEFFISPENTICSTPANFHEAKLLSAQVKNFLCNANHSRYSFNQKSETGNNTDITTDITPSTTFPTHTVNKNAFTVTHFFYAIIGLSVLNLIMVIIIIVILCIRCRKTKHDPISYKRNPSIDLLPIRPTSVGFYGEDNEEMFICSTLPLETNNQTDEDFYRNKTTSTFKKKTSISK